MAEGRKLLDREAVRSVIQQWNTNRLDLFALSEPDENLLFHGVMRFYFQDSGQKIATKCIRVASDATVSDVIDTLIEKFRPDMRMLSVPNYALYEVHANGDERRLSPDEKPLLVQLNWHVDDREGRFLLKNIDQKVTLTKTSELSFKRKLSKRDKKEIKKKGNSNGHKAEYKFDGSKQFAGTNNNNSNNNNEDIISTKGGVSGENNANGENRVAGKLYSELPETSFTRSISNPEAVMRRRRQQKLEKKLQQFRSRDGGPDTGGTLKIYGESLCRDVPYKTLLLSIRDCAQAVVREMLCKYGLERIDPYEYCLVQVNSDGSEYILDEDECPLSILMNFPTSRGSIMFHVRRRPVDSQPRRRKKKPLNVNGISNVVNDRGGPMLIEILHNGESGRQLILGTDPVEVGSANTNNLQLFGPSIQPRHCVIKFSDGVCTVTPLHTDALTFVNGHEINQQTILHNGSVVMFGRVASYRFVDSPPDGRYNLAFSQTQLDSPRLYESSHSPMSPGSWKDEEGALSSTQKSEYVQHAANNRSSLERELEDCNLENETKSISSMKSSGSNNQDRHSMSQKIEFESHGQEPILPAVLEFPETHQELFLQHIIQEVDVNAVHFKLAPAYSLYLCARYRASTHYRPELQPIERANKLTIFLHHVANLIHTVVQEHREEANVLAFWMANSSEFLHFLKSDRHICAFSMQAQDILVENVQMSFQYLLNCIQNEISQYINQFLSEKLDHDMASNSILRILGSVMVLLRRCRVNAALTIQLFSQLFHCINVNCFNKIMTNPNMCTSELGAAMSKRLELLELWAERQGLELAADCHLAKINQCAQFLQAPKASVEEIQQLACSCFRLNSLQMGALLKHADIPKHLVDTAIRMAKSVADELAHADGRKVQLEDPLELENALLLPDDGFSCDVVRGVPPGLVEFLNPLQQQNFCRLAAQPTSIGLWTVYMLDFYAASFNPTVKKLAQPDVQMIKLHKNSNGMGLSIVAAKGAGQERLGIYVKSVVSGGAAEIDGRLQAGDQLLRVDGQSLIGITQERAADYLVRTGPVVTLEVAKQGAIYHGLATLLQQPSPEVSNDCRSSDVNLSQMDAEGKNNRINNPHLYKFTSSIPNSKSVPALYHQSGRDTKSISQLKSHSINSLVMSKKNNMQGNMHEQQGFYQNLSVYAKQNDNRSELERPFNDMAYEKGDEQQQQIQRISSPIMQMTSSNLLLQDNNRQVHAQKENSGIINSATATTTAAAAATEYLNKPLPHFPDNIHESHNVDGSYANLNEYKPQHQQQHHKFANSPLTIGNRAVGHQNGKSELAMQPNLRVQQLLGPSMPNISNILNTHSPLQKIQGGGTSLHLASPFENSLGIAKSMQNVNSTESTIIDSRNLQNKVSNAMDYYAHHHPHHHQQHHSQHHLQQITEIDKNQFQLQNSYDGMMEVIQQQQQQQQNTTKPPLVLHMQNQQKHENNNKNVSTSSSSSLLASSTNMEIQQQQQQQQQLLYRMKRPILQPQQQQIIGNQILEKPPLPPTATHPLFKTQIPSNLIDTSKNNTNTTTTASISNMGNFQKKNTASNPWEREEREKEVEVRRGHIRMWRDQQIEELSSLLQRSPQQEEQLKTLILERDFERRVQELHDMGDDNEPAAYDKDYKEAYNAINSTKLSLNTNPTSGTAINTTTTTHPIATAEDSYKNIHKDSNSDFSEMTQQNFLDNNNSAITKSELPAMQNQQYSFNNNSGTSVQPKSILKNNRYDVATPSSPSKSQKSTSFADDRALKLEQAALKLPTEIAHLSLNQAQKMPSLAENMAVNANDGGGIGMGMASVEPPPPPERNSSFLLMARQSAAGVENGNEFTNNMKKFPYTDNVTTQKKLSQHFTTTNNNNNINNNSNNNNISNIINNNDSKHVSFQENEERALQQKLEYSLDFEREFDKQKSIADMDLNFNNNNSIYDDDCGSPAIDLAQDPTLWNTTIQSTPGVIGAQEVYRDPRQRRLAEKEQQLQQRNNEAVPEKLSFKEKMKMFALETGEKQSPREKLKISKAQRDIDVVQ